MLKSIDTVSNFIRAIVALAVVGMVGYGGWLGYTTYHEKDLALKDRDAALAASQAKIDDLHQDLAAKEREIERLATAVRLLTVDHRVALVRVLKQEMQTPGDPATLMTTFSFVEADDAGRPLEEPQTFTVRGDIVYFDAWVVKFKDVHVEQGDPLRGTSICLFRRVFGEHQTPSEGFEVDPVGSRPAAYSRGSEPSEIEKEIWDHFWEYATDPKKADEAELRAAQGEAPSMRLLPGKLYRIELRASGGLTIVPEDLPADGTGTG
jgi:hypothetical protein